MTRASLAEIDPFLEPQLAHAPTILLDPTKMGVETVAAVSEAEGPAEPPSFSNVAEATRSN
jgi:hypothetical protein